MSGPNFIPNAIHGLGISSRESPPKTDGRPEQVRIVAMLPDHVAAMDRVIAAAQRLVDTAPVLAMNVHQVSDLRMALSSLAVFQSTPRESRRRE